MADTTNKPVIFLAFANDQDDSIGYLRNLPDEARRLRDVLQPAEQGGLCEIVVRSNCTAADLFKVFQNPKYRNRIAILHYGGHANGYELLLESATSETASADASGLAAFLAQQHGLQLIVLNGCSTQKQALGLLEANIPSVIATSRSIDDQVATDFAHQFYQGLAGGASIRTAFKEAEGAILTTRGGDTRGLYFDNPAQSQDRPQADRWPWDLYLREGSENADQWNLPKAADAPLFGLPPLPKQDLPESPYRHLDWFTRKDAEVFFGRDHQIRGMYDRIDAPHSAPIMLFYGQSGVGKSSMLDAGLIPRLDQEYQVRYERRSAMGLLESLRQAVSPDVSDTPLDRLWIQAEAPPRKPLIVILDQVEECYTRPIAGLSDEVDQLLDALKLIFGDENRRPKGKLILGFRKEWLAELESRLIAYELPRTKFFLERLDHRGIIEVVKGPNATDRLRERYGLRVSEGLAELIADDMLEDRGSAVAPTLQILLTKMWTKATEENYEHPQINQVLYQDLKREGILLRDFLKQQIAEFRTRYPQAVDSGLLLDILVSHTTALGTADQCSQKELQKQYSHTGAALPDLLQHCQDLHLLTVVGDTGRESAKTTRLAHDTLAPLVRKNYDESELPGQRARRILDNRSVDWADDKTGTPLDEADLAIVEQGVNGTQVMSSTERRLLEASGEHLKRLHRNSKRIKIGGVLAVLSIIAAVVANQSQFIKTKKQERTALIQLGATEWQRAVSARDFEDDDIRSAHLFTAAALAFASADEPQRAKNSLIAIPDRVVRTFPYNDEFGPTGFVLNDDGTKVLSWASGNADEIVLWDIARDEPIRTFKHDDIKDAVFSDDGLRVLSWNYEGSLRVWDIAQAEPIRIFNHDGDPDAVFSDDGSQVLSWDYVDNVKLWDIEQGGLIRTFKHGSVQGAVFNDDGLQILSWDLDGIQLWDIVQAEPIRTFKQEGIYNAMFSGDGSQVLSRGFDDTRLWDIAKDEPIRTFERGAVLNGDETQALSWDNIDRVWLWDIAQDEPIRSFNQEWVEGAVFNVDATQVLSWNDDDSVLLWDIFQVEPIRTFKHNGVRGAVFNANGSQVLSWGDDDSVLLWDIAQDEPIRTFKQARVKGALFYDNDSNVLIWGNDNRVRLWNVTQGEEFQTFKHNGLRYAVFNDDESQVLSWSHAEGSIRLWDIGKDEPIRIFNHDRVEGAVFNADASQVLSFGKDDRIKLWDIGKDEPFRTFTHDGVANAVFNADGSQMLSWGRGDSIRLWDIGKDKPIRTYTHDLLESAEFNADGSQVLSWGKDDRIRLWDIGKDEPLRTFTHDRVEGAVFNADESQVLSWGRGDSIRLWDIGKDEPIHIFGHDRVTNAVFNADGSQMLSWGYDDTVRWWANGKNKPIRTFKHDGVANAVFNADGSQVLTWGYDNAIRLWRIGKDEPIRTFKHYGILDAVFNADGSQVLSWGDDSVRLWDSAQDEPIRTFKHRRVGFAVFNADGSQVLSWGDYDTIRLWSIPNFDDVSIDFIDAFKLRLETRTAASITEQGVYRLLNFSEWIEKRNKLSESN